MNILFVSWELDPFIKFGGLGDVARSLPGALREKGIDVRNVLPFYKALKFGKTKKKKKCGFYCDYNGKRERVIIYETENPLNKVPVYLLSNKKYLDIPKPPNTFAFFDKAICVMVKENKIGFAPDIIHCNDHHTGLIPLIVREEKIPVKTIFTIHNLSYQGYAEADVLNKIGFDNLRHRLLQWEIKSRQLNFLMNGILFADVVSTVSPTYAKEIMHETYGMGLDELLRGREGRVFGILNGVDLDYHHAMHINHVRYPYLVKKDKRMDPSETWEKDKMLNKKLLQNKLKLKVNNDIPLLCFIGRFDPRQKGIDILHRMLRRIDIEEYEIVILGSGNHEWEERFTWLSTFFPKNISCNFIFNERFARQIYAGSDFILVPSKFEPCGLIQMIAMCSGTLPIAHKTGGLADSIKDGENGFLFEDYTSHSLERALRRAIKVWKEEREKYKEMVKAAIRTDFTWDKSAEEYIKLYERLVRGEFD